MKVIHTFTPEEEARWVQNPVSLLPGSWPPAALLGNCQDCGNPVSKRGANRCWACFLKRGRVPEASSICQRCGGPMHRQAKTLCRKCWTTRGLTTPACPRCGEPMSVGATYCKACWHIVHARSTGPKPPRAPRAKKAKVEPDFEAAVDEYWIMHPDLTHVQAAVRIRAALRAVRNAQ